MQKQLGFTLIEFMVAVAIMVLLAKMAAPLTGGWNDAANVRNATHRLLEGMARAKALALNNPDQKASGTAAAYLLWDGSNFCIYEANPKPDKLSCSAATNASPSWSTQATATVTLDSATNWCVALDNRALAVSATTIDTTTCSTGLLYSIKSTGGNQPYPSTGTNVLY